jgi:hypothetical protein
MSLAQLTARSTISALNTGDPARDAPRTWDDITNSINEAPSRLSHLQTRQKIRSLAFCATRPDWRSNSHDSMATETMTLREEPTTLYYFLEVKDGGIIQTYPGTAFEKRRKHVPHDVTIRDLRPIQDQFTLENAGFQLVKHVSKEKSFIDEKQVEEVYYPECQELIKRLYAQGSICMCTVWLTI